MRMNRRTDIEQKVQEALESLDGIQRAEPQPYFYTRLKARLQRDERTVWETIGSFMSRPAVVAAGLCMVVVLNVFVLFRQDTATVASANPVMPSLGDLVTDNEYVLATSSSFDYENFDQQ